METRSPVVTARASKDLAIRLSTPEAILGKLLATKLSEAKVILISDLGTRLSIIGVIPGSSLGIKLLDQMEEFARDLGTRFSASNY